MGMLKDDPALLRTAADYLENYAERLPDLALVNDLPTDKRPNLNPTLVNRFEPATTVLPEGHRLSRILAYAHELNPRYKPRKQQ
jgi:hypothetical protein